MRPRARKPAVGVAFQFYFSQTPAHLQNDELKAQFRELDKWLGHCPATHYGQPTPINRL